MIYLDTHVVAWLYEGKINVMPEKIQDEISKERLQISPIVILELQYLFEIGRVSKKGLNVVQDLEKRVGLKICQLPFEAIISSAIEQKWTRDPFDRIIVAQASMQSSRLVTKDITIRKNYRYSLWG